jgi:hypothetical protein
MNIIKKLFVLLILFFAQNVFAAANFTIAPTSTLPTTVLPGQSVSAFYTLTNMTNTTRAGYVIQGLPGTVIQNTTPPYCTNPVNLAPHASCQLCLDVSGAASANIALCKGSSCTTASSPLNVSVTPVTVPTGPTPPKYLYVINAYSSPPASVCTLDGTSGAILSCQDAGGESVFGVIPLQGIVINNTNTVAFISNANGSNLTPYTYQCQIDPSSHTFSACTSTTITSPTGYTPYEGMLGINSTSTIAYLTDNAGRVLACPIVSNAINGTCVNTGAAPISTNVASVVVNKAGTTAYIGNYNSPTGVEVCAANGSSFTGCVNKTGGNVGATPFTFQTVGGPALNYQENTVYIPDFSGSKVYGCSTTPSGATTFANCFVANSTNPAFNVVINATNTVAYLSNYGTNVYTCPILPDGTFPTCTTTTFTGDTVGLALLY